MAVGGHRSSCSITVGRGDDERGITRPGGGVNASEEKEHEQDARRAVSPGASTRYVVPPVKQNCISFCCWPPIRRDCAGRVSSRERGLRLRFPGICTDDQPTTLTDEPHDTRDVDPVTTKSFVIEEVPNLFDTVSVTGYVPGWRKMTAGLLVLVQASPPKSQRHDVGEPDEVSVSRT